MQSKFYFKRTICAVYAAILVVAVWQIEIASAKEPIIATVCNPQSGQCVSADNSPDTRQANRATWRDVVNYAKYLCNKAEGYGCNEYRVCRNYKHKIVLKLVGFSPESWCSNTASERRYHFVKVVELCISNWRNDGCNTFYHTYGGDKKTLKAMDAEIGTAWVQAIAYSSGLTSEKPTGKDTGNLNDLITEIQKKYGEQQTGKHGESLSLAIKMTFPRIDGHP